MSAQRKLLTAPLCLLVLFATDASAERAPVLNQIAVPHDYYYREMYLPQLTSGPSALAWSPDSTEIVYSMQGSLWRQPVNSDTAIQLTAGPGYDYQPDWSPDGDSIVFVRYENDALELNLYDMATGRIQPLTTGGDVNVEPRFSPDGAKLAWVSTTGTGRFHVFAADVVEDSLDGGALFEERQSETPRYYYSSIDHEISPAWTPDGESLIYIANPETPYGTGSIYLRDIDGNDEPRLVRREETSWKARPDVAPDGNRLVYSSYLGRQWHQMWVAGMDNVAEPFPLTYGDFDITAARWSPDSTRVAYVANENGNTEIRIRDVVGGRTTTLPTDARQYIVPTGTLNIAITDADDRAVAARVSVLAADGRSYAPDGSLVHADDGFDREAMAFETQYFHAFGTARLTLPAGPATVTIWRGLEHEVERRDINVAAGEEHSLAATLRPLDMPASWRNFASGDVHVHMNYGGTYRNTPAYLVQQANAEDLDVVFNLIVNKEQRVPDIAYFDSQPDPASNPGSVLLHAQEFHTSFWGHMGLLGLTSHLLVPDYAAYPFTGAASIYPDNATIVRLAKEQGAVAGYVHPFLAPPPDPASDPSLTNALPVDAALGLVDYYEVVGFADHRASAEVWYGLLNCGLKVAAAGGTDAMANYASLHGPVGLQRTYARVDSDTADNEERRDRWLQALEAGRTIATNGPLLDLRVNGAGPGDTLELAGGRHELHIEGFLRSIVPIDHLEIVWNGAVQETIALDGDRRSADLDTRIAVDGSGWLLLRAWNDSADPLVFDYYPYGTTSPVYVSSGDAPLRSREAADYFTAWVERVRDAADSHEGYMSEAEKDTVLGNIDEALRVYAACRP